MSLDATIRKEADLTFEQRALLSEYQNVRYHMRISVLSLVLLCTLALGMLVFLIVTSSIGLSKFSQFKSCVVGSAALVHPGPGDTTANAFWNGDISFDTSAQSIEWDFTYGNLGAVTGLDIIGPVDVGDPLDGPVFLSLCGVPATPLACLGDGMNTLSQTIYEAPATGEPLVAFSRILKDDRSRYLIKIKTQAFPDGALVARLNTAC